MDRLLKKLKQNPKLVSRKMSDGRTSLCLEYYLGRSETPVCDDNGNRVRYVMRPQTIAADSVNMRLKQITQTNYHILFFC